MFCLVSRVSEAHKASTAYTWAGKRTRGTEAEANEAKGAGSERGVESEP